MRSLLIVFLFPFFAGWSFAQSGSLPAAPEAAKDLEQIYLQKHQENYESLIELQASYINALRKLRDAKQGEGALAAMAEIDEEIEHLHERSRLLQPVKDPELATRKRVYAREFQNKVRLVAPQEIKLLEAYRTQLKDRTQDLTRRGELDTAVALNNYLKHVDAFLAELRESSGGPDEPGEYGEADWKFIATAIQKEQVKRSSEIPGENFYDLGTEPGVLAGFQLRLDELGGNQIVRGVQAIFRLPDGSEVVSDVAPGTRNPDQLKKVVAKDGYAVGRVESKMAPFTRQMRIHFYKITGAKLEPADSYTSDWYGEWDQPSTLAVEEAGENIAVGIYGKGGAGLDQLGLIFLDPM